MNIIALSSDVASGIRQRTHDHAGNVLEAEVQTAYGNPCRHCLRRANPGERLLLFSYSPFDTQNPYNETGPIFVHADGCARYSAPHEFPPDFSAGSIVLRGYDAAQRIARVSVVVDGRAPHRAQELLADPEIAFVHARSFTHGCYLFRIERAA
jgi:Protein of unknown function (DUF1203)